MCGNNNNFIVSNKGKQHAERNSKRMKEMYTLFCKSHEFACFQHKKVSKDIGLLAASKAVHTVIHTYS